MGRAHRTRGANTASLRAVWRALTVQRSFLVDSQGAPVRVQVGSDPSSAPRYYSVYNAHGDGVDLSDTQGNLVATYSYDSQGALTSSNETFTNGANGWTNPYRCDGRDGARYDATTGPLLALGAPV